MSIDLEKLQADVAATKEAVEFLLAWARQNATNPATSTDEEVRLPHKEAADFLGIAPQTLYQNKAVKRTKRFGKLYFLKSDLVDYLKSGTAQ